MRKLIFGLMACLMTTLAYGQGGNVGLGLRLSPDGGGFTGKFFLDRNFAIEAQLNAGGLYEGSSIAAVGLLEYHIVLPDPSWRIFFGGGFHFGTWDKDRDQVREGDDRTEGIFGMDAIGGVEYVFKRIPLGLSADIKPAVNFVETAEFFPHNVFGIAGRFYFGRNMKPVRK